MSKVIAVSFILFIIDVGRKNTPTKTNKIPEKITRVARIICENQLFIFNSK